MPQLGDTLFYRMMERQQAAQQQQAQQAAAMAQVAEAYNRQQDTERERLAHDQQTTGQLAELREATGQPLDVGQLDAPLRASAQMGTLAAVRQRAEQERQQQNKFNLADLEQRGRNQELAQRDALERWLQGERGKQNEADNAAALERAKIAAAAQRYAASLAVGQKQEARTLLTPKDVADAATALDRLKTAKANLTVERSYMPSKELDAELRKLDEAIAAREAYNRDIQAEYRQQRGVDEAAPPSEPAPSPQQPPPTQGQPPQPTPPTPSQLGAPPSAPSGSIGERAKRIAEQLAAKNGIIAPAGVPRLGATGGW
jgi:hypothetical protein